MTNNMQRLLRSSNHHQRTIDEEVHFFSEQKVRVATRILAVTLASAVLLIPVLVLSLVDMSQKAASVVVLVFVMTFAACKSLFSGARLESLFVGTCALVSLDLCVPGLTDAPKKVLRDSGGVFE
jgi:VIT1/CCC1 family predicted Fe2+/Mn2+ transporter